MGVVKISAVLILLVVLFGFFLLFGEYIIHALDRAMYEYDKPDFLESLTCEQLLVRFDNPPYSSEKNSIQQRIEIRQIMEEKNCEPINPSDYLR